MNHPEKPCKGRSHCSGVFDGVGSVFSDTEGGAVMAAPMVKVRCSDQEGCGWSGERADAGAPTAQRCPWCHLYSVELVGRTPNPTEELVAYTRARKEGCDDRAHLSR